MKKRKRLATVTLFTLLLAAVGSAPFANAGHSSSCFMCARVDIAPPGQDPAPRATCFDWGDQHGWAHCIQVTTICLLWDRCSVFD